MLLCTVMWLMFSHVLISRMGNKVISNLESENQFTIAACLVEAAEVKVSSDHGDLRSVPKLLTVASDLPQQTLGGIVQRLQSVQLYCQVSIQLL